jgi:hypothetical protein
LIDAKVNYVSKTVYTEGNVATVADSGSSDIVVSGSGSETAAVTLGLSTTGVAAGCEPPVCSAPAAG